ISSDFEMLPTEAKHLLYGSDAKLVETEYQKIKGYFKFLVPLAIQNIFISNDWKALKEKALAKRRDLSLSKKPTTYTELGEWIKELDNFLNIPRSKEIADQLLKLFSKENRVRSDAISTIRKTRMRIAGPILIEVLNWEDQSDFMKLGIETFQFIPSAAGQNLLLDFLINRPEKAKVRWIFSGLWKSVVDPNHLFIILDFYRIHKAKIKEEGAYCGFITSISNFPDYEEVQQLLWESIDSDNFYAAKTAIGALESNNTSKEKIALFLKKHIAKRTSYEHVAIALDTYSQFFYKDSSFDNHLLPSVDEIIALIIWARTDNTLFSPRGNKTSLSFAGKLLKNRINTEQIQILLKLAKGEQEHLAVDALECFRLIEDGNILPNILELACADQKPRVFEAAVETLCSLACLSDETYMEIVIHQFLMLLQFPDGVVKKALLIKKLGVISKRKNYQKVYDCLLLELNTTDDTYYTASILHALRSFVSYPSVDAVFKSYKRRTDWSIKNALDRFYRTKKVYEQNKEKKFIKKRNSDWEWYE
ncbi:MAG: hypothetical protein AAF798_15615, partial [Bacteroidota bacterium]